MSINILVANLKFEKNRIFFFISFLSFSSKNSRKNQKKFHKTNGRVLQVVLTKRGFFGMWEGVIIGEAELDRRIPTLTEYTEAGLHGVTGENSALRRY